MVVAGPNAYLGMVGSRALGQMRSVQDVVWPGLVIEHRTGSVSVSSEGDLHHLVIRRGDVEMVEDVVRVERPDDGHTPDGVLAGLNVDGDAELEIVHCERGRLQAYYDYEPADASVVVHMGMFASDAAQEVCVDVARGAERPNLANAGWCGAPLLFLFFLALRSDRRAARSRDDVPTGF